MRVRGVKLLLGAYALTWLGLAGVLLLIGRRSVLEHYTFVPELQFMSHTAWESRSEDGELVVRREIPELEIRTLDDGEPAMACSVLRVAETPPEILFFVCPGAGGPAAMYLAPLWMASFADNLVCFTFDYPGMGRSPGETALERVLPFARRAFDEAAQEFPKIPIVLIGCSLGAAPALALAAERPEVDYLVLDSACDLEHEVQRRRFARWIPPLFFFTPTLFANAVPPDLQLDRWATKLPDELHVLVATGTEDPVVDVQVSQELAAELGSRGELWALEADVHAILPSDDRLARDLIARVEERFPVDLGLEELERLTAVIAESRDR